MFWIDYIGFQGFATRKKKIETNVKTNLYVLTADFLPSLAFTET